MSTQRIGGAANDAPQPVGLDPHDKAGGSGTSSARPPRSTPASSAKQQLKQNMAAMRGSPGDRTSSPAPTFAASPNDGWPAARPSATIRTDQPMPVAAPVPPAMRYPLAAPDALNNVNSLQQTDGMRDMLRQYRLTLLQSFIDIIRQGLEVMKKASEPIR